jgi:hypothetical protein
MLTPEEQAELQRLLHEHIPIRAIARRLGRDVKTIRRALGRPPRPPAPPKLAPYHPLIQQWCAQGLRSPRILRELRARGYTGGATILKDFLPTLGPRRPPRPVVRRFETGPGLEAQSALHRRDHRGEGYRPCRLRPSPARVLRAHGGRAPGPARRPRGRHLPQGLPPRGRVRPADLGRRGVTELGREAANELFRIVSARTRVRSTLVVTNLPFTQWGEFLPSPAQAVAIADRLVDNATILRFTGKPYRQPRAIHGAPLEDE